MRLPLRSALTLSLALSAIAFAGCGGSSGTATCGGGNCPTAVPAVTSNSPAAGATGVALTTAVTATFDMPMNSATLTTTTFTLAGSAGAVAGTVSYSAQTATFTPSSSLAYNTQYTATVTTGAESAAGGFLSANYIWTFTTASAPAPSISAEMPASGATNVDVGTTVTATFSEAMQASTVIAAFTLADASGNSVPGAVTYDPSTNTATFTPSDPLTYAATYTAAITTDATASNGASLATGFTWNFTTVAAPPLPAPQVSSTTPASLATGAAVNTAVTATFTEAMNTTTLSNATFTLVDSGAAVNGQVTYNAATDTATFTPAALLSYNTVYTASITTGAQNTGGIGLPSNYSWSFTTEAAPSGMVTVDYGTQEQLIRGFGGSTAWLGQLTQAQANALFSPATGLGLSILRVRIDPTGSSTTSPPWVPANGNWLQEATNATEELAANPNAIVFASPWTPPTAMKTGSQSGQPYYSGSAACSPGPGYCGGSLDPSSYAAYAAYLNAFIAYFNAASSNPLYAVSMQNEPDWSAQPTENYESCSWTPAQMDAWIDAEGSTLSAPLLMPESLNFNPAQAAPSLSDATAVSDISIIGGHLYGTSPSYETQAENAGKDIWMTEHYLTPSGAQTNISDALSTAEEIHNSMVIGQYNAYVWWWIWDQASYINYGLIDSNTGTPTPTYFGYAIGQFSKFIQPGYYRYNLTAPASSTLFFSAYGGDGHYVIVAINSGTSSVSQSFTIQNATLSSMTPWQTTAASGLQQLSPVSISAGQFTDTLPAQSITTFVQ